MMQLGQLVKIGHLRCNCKRISVEREMCNLEEVYGSLFYLVQLYLLGGGRCFFCFFIISIYWAGYASNFCLIFFGW